MCNSTEINVTLTDDTTPPTPQDDYLFIIIAAGIGIATVFAALALRR